MLSLLLLAMLGRFDGLFLWAAPDQSAAVYCQLVNAAGTISGDCYSRSVNPGEHNGVKEDHIEVEGTDGNRVVFRVHGLFGVRATWGTAQVRASGFVLELSSSAGVQAVEFTRASASMANTAMGAVGRRGAAARSSAQAAAALQRARNDYYELAAEIPGAQKELALARGDSVGSSAEADTVMMYRRAVMDSLRAERVDFKRGYLESRVGAADWRLNAAQSRVQRATERIKQEIDFIASTRAQMKRDSLYVVSARRR